MRATDRLAKLIAAIDKSIQEELYGHAAFTLRTPAAERLYRAPNDQVRSGCFRTMKADKALPIRTASSSNIWTGIRLPTWQVGVHRSHCHRTAF